MIDSTMPYMYNMSPDVPNPMGQQPVGASGFTPSYPNAMSQQPYQPAQQPPSGGLNIPRYAKGGSINSMANKLRSAGQRGDDILAHINPSEASELQRTHGMDINPHTGLPQYGLYDALDSVYNYGRDSLNNAGNYIEGLGRDIWKDYGYGAVDQGLGYLDNAISGALPALGTAAGTFAGGAMGAPVAGATTGGLAGQKLSDRYNQSGGARGYLMPKLASYFGGPNSGQPMSPAGQTMHKLDNVMGNDVRGMMSDVASKAPAAMGNAFNQARNYFNSPSAPQRPMAPSPSRASASPMSAMPQMGNQPPAQNFSAPQPQYATRASMLGMNDSMGNPIPQMRQPQMATRASMLGQSNPYQFADGGHVSTLDRMAEKVRGYGEGGDDVLAHINPMEAMELDQKYGSDINPETGLPQFGKHRRKWGILGTLAAIGAAPFTGGSSLAMIPSMMTAFDKNEKGPRFVPNAPSIADQMGANPVPTAKGLYTNEQGNLTIPKLKRKVKKYDPDSYDYMEPEHDFFEDEYENNNRYAMGGPIDYDRGGYVNDSSDGKKDKVNARLSGGEYVWTAPEVAFFGGGNNEAGAKWLDKFREKIGVDSRFNPDHQGRMMDKLMKMVR